jgi:hypothetical protein
VADLSEFEAISPSGRMKSERDDAKRRLEQAHKNIEELEKRFDLVTSIDGLTANPPKWLLGKKNPKGYHGIANTISSDQHFGEVVRPEEMAGTNAYNMKIAKMRFKKHMEKFCSLGTEQLGYLKYDGAHIWWNGDAFSGDIHEELAKTNEMSTLATLEDMIDPVVAGFKLAADTYGNLHVSSRRGNHTRTSRKTPSKGRVKESYDWLFMRVVAREFRGDKRVTFDIPENDDGEIITQYKTRYLATHGDQFKGGSGIAGIMTPLALGNYKKLRRQVSVGQPYDVMILGHFHTYLTIPGIIVNGSLKGYDEYASTNNMGYEDPLQAFWVTTPEHGPSFHTAIMVADRKAEGW